MNPWLSRLGLNVQPQQQPAQGPNPSGPLAGLNANLNTVIGIYNTVKGSSDPVATLNQMAQTDQNVSNTINYINQNGGDMNKIAETLANQNGLSLSMLLGLFKK